MIINRKQILVIWHMRDQLRNPYVIAGSLSYHLFICYIILPPLKHDKTVLCVVVITDSIIFTRLSQINRHLYKWYGRANANSGPLSLFLTNSPKIMNSTAPVLCEKSKLCNSLEDMAKNIHYYSCDSILYIHYCCYIGL